MNIEERMAMINNKVAKDKDAEQKKQRELMERESKAIETIRSYKSRIDDLIKLANYARENGIDFNRSGWGGHEGYDTGMFYTNSWSHLVGFVYETPIKLLGINAGGACGSINFRTDGKEIYGTECGKKINAKLADMERFIRRFDTFESEFYAYIEKMCK